MKIHITLSCLLFLWATPADSGDTSLPEDKQARDIEKMFEGSGLQRKFREIVPIIDGSTHKYVEVSHLIEFLQINSDDMFGDVENLIKFQNLMQFDMIVRSHPDNRQIVPHLFRKFEELTPLERKENMNWGEMMVAIAGGPLGQTIHLLASIGGREAIAQMLDHAIEAEDIPKLEEIVIRLANVEQKHPYKDLIEQRIRSDTPDQINAMLRAALEE